MYTLKDVSKTYRSPDGGVTALHQVSLVIGEGEWVAIQGPTGGGKSTLLQLLGGLERPSSGDISFGTDADVVRLDTLAEQHLSGIRAKQIGFIFQNFNLIPTLNAVENVAAALWPLGVRGASATARARDALSLVGLGDRLAHLPAALSGGQQQRVAIARALVKDPRVILADEPTGNLDENTRDDIVALFEQVREVRQLTLVMVTHDRELAARAGRVLTLNGARLIPSAV